MPIISKETMPLVRKCLLQYFPSQYITSNTWLKCLSFTIPLHYRVFVIHWSYLFIEHVDRGQKQVKEWKFDIRSMLVRWYLVSCQMGFSFNVCLSSKSYVVTELWYNMHACCTISSYKGLGIVIEKPWCAATWNYNTITVDNWYLSIAFGFFRRLQGDEKMHHSQLAATLGSIMQRASTYYVSFFTKKVSWSYDPVHLTMSLSCGIALLLSPQVNHFLYHGSPFSHWRVRYSVTALTALRNM